MIAMKHARHASTSRLAMLTALVLGSFPGVAVGVTVRITNPAEENPAKMVLGASHTFECVVDDLGNEDYYVVWHFDDSQDIEECGKSTACEYTPQRAGRWAVTVMVMDNADPGLPIAEDSSQYAVLWVALHLVSEGDCPAEDNNKREKYSTITRPLDKANRYELGHGAFYDCQGCGVALRGQVTPGDWEHPVDFLQFAWGGVYKGVDGTIPGTPWMDGTLDVQPEWCDCNAPFVYLMDHPGPARADGEIRRMRCNFRTWVVWQGPRCSDEVAWYTKTSWHKTGPEEFDWSLHSDVPNDNQTAEGDPIPTTWNLE